LDAEFGKLMGVQRPGYAFAREINSICCTKAIIGKKMNPNIEIPAVLKSENVKAFKIKRG
jgi:hypothetical protein